MAVRGVVAYDKLHDRAVGSRGKPDQAHTADDHVLCDHQW